MNRRHFLKLITAIALYSPFVRSSNKNLKIVVIGAGIIGTFIAYELSRYGIDVTLIDKNKPGSGTSGSSFNWVNATYPKKPYSYNYFAQLGINSYKNLLKEIDISIEWNGSLEWFNLRQDQLDLLSEISQLMNYPTHTKHEIINSEQANILEPSINFNNNKNIVYSKDDGTINTRELINLLIKNIKINGGKVITECEYKKLNFQKTNISSVSTSLGNIDANKVVFACGIDTNSLLSKNYLIKPTPGVIIKSKPYKKIINKIIVGPGIHFYQQSNGQIIIGEQGSISITDTKSLKNRLERFSSRSIEMNYLNKIRSMGGEFFEDIFDLEIDEVSIGWRPIPIDGKPIIGRLDHNPNIYLATMHSGISLGPLVGSLVARELVQDIEIPVLENFRPSRFD